MINVTLKGIFRDRVFQGIFTTAILFLFIPSISSLSMRQVTELSITLSLSLISFILLLLAVFLGSASLWRDQEKRYAYGVLGLPISRSSYVLGKFVGASLFLILSATLLAVATFIAVWYSSHSYPPLRPIVWHYLFLAIFYDLLKYILLISIAFLLSAVSTSFFLPIFGTISFFMVGSATQGVHEYLATETGKKLPEIVRVAAKGLYYILPNFSAFDLKLNAIYGIKVSVHGLLLTLIYSIIYTALVLFLGTTIFSRREIK